VAGYLEELFGLVGQTAVVTGGGGTLGGALAEALARAGADVVLWGRTRATLERRARAITERCGGARRAEVVTADLLEEAQVERALAETLERVGHFEILVNAAGGNRGRAPFAEIPASDYQAVLHLNLLAGCVLPLQCVARYWIRAGIQGSVVNLASLAADRPLSGVSAYAAAKAGVVSATRAAARELAPHGIRVNALAPGFFLGEQNRALLVDADTGRPTERGASVLARTPFGRFGEPDELAGACLLLASERAGGFLTGVTLPIDGGFSVESI
jgi:NAD(P)-dependent dehydrogenase (short-subunit alcohol dehydrogenase family)